MVFNPEVQCLPLCFRLHAYMGNVAVPLSATERQVQTEMTISLHVLNLTAAKYNTHFCIMEILVQILIG